MKSLLNILAISLIFVLAGCEKHEKIGEFGNEGGVNIILKCIGLESPGSTKSIDEGQMPDEGTGNGYKVKDYWVLQYTSGGDFIENSDKYVSVEDGQENYKTPVIMPTEGNAYYCLFIANTHNPELDKEFDEWKGSLSSMRNFYKNIEKLEDTYNIAEKDLIMSGIAELPYGATELYCRLYRNIAKITVELINKEGSDLTIKSVNIKNVPGSALYADALYKEPGIPVNIPEAPYPQSQSVDFFDYELDNVNVAAGETKSLVWYLPRNIRGNVSDVTSADLKNKYAPESATYIEIFAVTGNGGLYRYRFYLGENATTNFDVVPNRHYKLPITFVDKGNVSDSRVGDYSSIELSSNSNSFIINPLPVEMQSVYSLPVSRVNKFWTSTDAQAGVDNTLSENTEWVAEVIWQDQPQRLMSFVDDNGNSADTFTGKGNTSFKFKVVQGAKGNVLVGVRKPDETNYLWSWHLWITDYNPDECTTTWIQNKYVYYVSGGQVHRYAGDYWNNNCENRYIMDRNLGAMSATKTDDIKKTGGLLYQYGRKDPFMSIDTKLYKIDGETETSFSLQSPGSIYNSVYLPYKFNNVNSGDWVTSNPYIGDNKFWNSTGTNKSIYDPCPEGWMIPSEGTYEIFGKNKAENNEVNYQSKFTEPGYEGIEFCVDSADDHKEYNIAYFPAIGNIHPNTGLSNKLGERGTLHTLNSSDGNDKGNCYPFEFIIKNTTKITTATSSSKAKAASIRCIREKAQSGGNEYNNDKKNEEYNQVPW